MPTLSVLSRRLAAVTLLSLAAVAPTGCGKEAASGVPVTGKATVDGTPLTRGTVQFVPDKAKGNTATVDSFGTITPTGEYSLVTNGKPGASLGWYKVSVKAAEMPDSSKPNAPTKSDVAAKYNDPEKSGLVVEVVSSPAAGAYDLKTTAK